VPNSPRRRLILSVDFEDWHQLVRRRLGIEPWDQPSAPLARQTETLLRTLDELGLRSTFFILGLTARRHPELVREIAARGHEIASHGFAHRPVFGLSPDELRDDLKAAIELLDELTGARPHGYRAPAFSINRATPWALPLLAELGFRYDSSRYDSPRVPDRLRPVRPAPFPIELSTPGDACARATLWELPLAAWRRGPFVLPVGGGAYWSVLPSRVLLHALTGLSAQGPAALYIHPYECDPEPLRAGVTRDAPARQRARARAREQQRNAGRGRALAHLRLLASRFELITCAEAVRSAEALRRAEGRPAGAAPASLRAGDAISQPAGMAP
jgi:polysaccharide deacetylase family protein (PEP-CTERM system associated)